jgi:hypothetical protein
MYTMCMRVYSTFVWVCAKCLCGYARNVCAGMCVGMYTMRVSVCRVWVFAKRLCGYAHNVCMGKFATFVWVCS